MNSSSASRWARLAAALTGFLAAFVAGGVLFERSLPEPGEAPSARSEIAIPASELVGRLAGYEVEEMAVGDQQRIAIGERLSPKNSFPNPGVFIQGQVTKPDGTPRKEAVVRALRDGQELARNQVDRQGRYVLGPFSGSKIELVADELRYREARVKRELDSSVRFERVDLVLQPEPRVKIYVQTPEGGPLHLALAAEGSSLSRFDCAPVATLTKPGARFAPRTGGPEQPEEVGVWALYGLEAPGLGDFGFGWLFLQQGPPCWISFVAGDHVLASQYIGPGAEEVRFVIDPDEISVLSTRLHGRVLSAYDGKPVEGARIVHSNPVSGKGTWANSDDEGYFWIESASPSHTKLTLSAEGFATLRREVVVEPKENHHVGLLLLEPQVRIQGQLLGDDGQPVRGVLRIGVHDASTGSVDWSNRRFVQTDPAGMFEVRDLAGGTYVLQPGDLKGPTGQAVQVDTALGPRADVELRLQRGAVAEGW